MRSHLLRLLTVNLLAISTVAAGAFNGNNNGISQPLAVRLDKDNRILKYDRATGKTILVYKSDMYWVHDLTVSPDEQHIGFIEETKPEYDKGGFSVAPKFYLTIIDSDGKLYRHIEKDVKKYVWSPDGSQIGFLTFRPCDPDYEFKCPSGAWRIDLQSSAIVKIRDQADEIFWAMHDSAIYLYDHQIVYRFDSQSQIVRPTNYRDIYFSPDGQYYLDKPKFEEESAVQLFRSKDNIDMSDAIPKDMGEPVGWTMRTGHMLLLNKPVLESKSSDQTKVRRAEPTVSNELWLSLYDVELKRVIKQVKGKMNDWRGSGKFMIVKEDDLSFQEIP
jgi:dipeptidyl aminopeptidase/acylaminoacyl peptidase